jgi:hypothetical protein
MNLKDIIEYRDRCIICNHQMQIKHIPESSHNLSCFVKDNGFRARSKSSKGVFYLFGFDGTLTKGKRDFGMGYKTPLHFIKECPYCKPMKSRIVKPQPISSGKNIILKSRSAGMTTMGAALSSYSMGTRVGYTPTNYMGFSNGSTYTSIGNVKSYGCRYLFDLTCGKDGNYTSTLISEMIRYPGENAFYHVHTDFVEDTTTINHGLYSSPLDKILTINTPSKTMNHVKTKEELIEKFKLYSLFS